MRLSAIGENSVRAALMGEGLTLDLGAASVRIRSDVSEVAEMLQTVYGAYSLAANADLFDVTIALRQSNGLRRWLRPQVELWIDGSMEFERFPRDTPLPLLEWGINYALATRLNCYLLLHSGALERNGRGVLLPAMPGSGKSTLTAALSRKNYRLLSDEFGVIRTDRRMLAMLRPIALKNESIQVLRSLDPSATIGPSFPKTRKGTVAHLAPQARDVDAIHEPVTPRCIVFPQYDAAADADLEPLSGSRAFARLVVNSFNYELLGPGGFDTLCDVVQSCDCYELRYGNLANAMELIDQAVDSLPPGEVRTDQPI
jgi:HprK-related kinase A